MTGGTFPLRPAVVLNAVADRYHLTPGELFTYGRAGERIGQARRVAYLLLHTEAWMSWREVCQYMGKSVSSVGTITAQGHEADPVAIDEIRSRLYNGTQGSLW